MEFPIYPFWTLMVLYSSSKESKKISLIRWITSIHVWKKTVSTIKSAMRI